MNVRVLRTTWLRLWATLGKLISKMIDFYYAIPAAGFLLLWQPWADSIMALLGVQPQFCTDAADVVTFYNRNFCRPILQS